MKQVVAKFIRRGDWVPFKMFGMLLLYASVVLFYSSLEDAQKFMRALEVLIILKQKLCLWRPKISIYYVLSAIRRHLNVNWSIDNFSILCVVLVLLYGVEEWAISSLSSLWKEFEIIQKHFLIKFLQVRKEISYTFLLFELKLLPSRSTMERVTEYMLKGQ